MYFFPFLVPPTQLTILDHHGAAIREQKAGPYLEGDSINLTCLSSGGIPPPRVSWWREHALVDDTYQVLPDGTVRNVLHLKNISRKDLLTVCVYIYISFFLYLEIRFYNFILFFLYNFTPTVIYVYVSKEHMCVIVFLIDMSVCLGYCLSICLCNILKLNEPL